MTSSTKFLKSAILCVLVASFPGQSRSHISDKNSTNIDCASICTASDAQLESGPETKLCKCPLSEHLDDVDLALFRKNAILTQKTADSIRPYHEKTISKREADEATMVPPVPLVPQPLDETPATDPIPVTTTEMDLNPEAIVGQAPANRRTNQRGAPPRRQREPRPISLDQQRLISQQITDHLTRLGQQSDQRLRDGEIQAIKNNLRQLSNTVLVQAPQMRSRMRNVVEEARRRSARPRLIHSRIVGAPFPNFENQEETKDVDTAVKGTLHGKRRHEIVTQDPKLIDE